MGDTKAHMAAARDALKALPEVSLVQASPLYFTEPQGLKEQAWFCNQVVQLHCAPSWTSAKLLQALLAIETTLGRTRSTEPALRYGPRVMDMDILLFGHEVNTDAVCTIPHPRMLERAFVLIPLRHVLGNDTLLGLAELEEALRMLPYRVDGDKIYQ